MIILYFIHLLTHMCLVITIILDFYGKENIKNKNIHPDTTHILMYAQHPGLQTILQISLMVVVRRNSS